MKIMKMKKGDRLISRWPNTRFYYWCTIIEPKGADWKIQFDDGTITVVKAGDLHDSLPADAANAVGRVTRSSPTKTRKIPEEIKKSPSRKARKLFVLEENVTLNTESSGVEDNATSSGTPGHTRRSVSVTQENENMTHRVADVRQSIFLYRSSDSVTKEIEDETQSTADERPSASKTSVSEAIQKESVTHGTADERPSASKRSVSAAIQKESVTHGSEGLRASPFRGSQTLLQEREKLTAGSEGLRASPFRGSQRLLQEREKLTAESAVLRPSPIRGSVNLLTERMKLTSESTGIRSSPIRGSDSLLKEEVKLTDDVTRYTKSYLDKGFRRQLIVESSIGSAGLRPPPIRGSDNLLKETVKLEEEMTRYKEPNLDRDYQRQLWREGSFGTTDTFSSAFRRSVSGTKENKNMTHGTTHTTKFTLQDYKKKYLNKFPMEFGGRYGSLLLILLLPVYIMSVVFYLVPDTTKFEVLFGKHFILISQVAGGIMLLLSFQAVLTIVPIGSVASGPLTKLGISNMRCNGIFAAVFTLILTMAAFYLKMEVCDIVVNVHSEAAVVAMLLGIVFSLILYRRADKLSVFYLNPYGSTGFMWYDFWMGREISPFFGKFNIKLILHRFSVIITIALNALIVRKACVQGMEEDILKSLMMSTVLQSLYCVHFLLHEDIYLYSFLAISEGVGYMIAVGFMTYPFILTFTTRAILDYRLKATLIEQYIALCAYTIGYLLLESSSYRKTLSVKDRSASIWTIKLVPKWSPGIQTRTYIGEILIYWAFAMVAGTTQLWLFIIPSAFTFSVLSRAHREYKRSAVYSTDEISTKQK